MQVEALCHFHSGAYGQTAPPAVRLTAAHRLRAAAVRECGRGVAAVDPWFAFLCARSAIVQNALAAARRFLACDEMDVPRPSQLPLALVREMNIAAKLEGYQRFPGAFAVHMTQCMELEGVGDSANDAVETAAWVGDYVRTLYSMHNRPVYQQHLSGSGGGFFIWAAADGYADSV